MRMLLSALALAALASSPAAAAPKPKKAAAKPAPLDPALAAAAADVVALTGVEQANDASLTAQADEIRSGALVSAEIERNPDMKAARGKNPDGWAPIVKRFGERQADILVEVKTGAEGEFHDRLVHAYATHFTLDELNDLKLFYASPVGHKLVATIPPLMSDTMAWLQDTIGARMGPRIHDLRGDFLAAVQPLMTGDAPPPAPEPSAPVTSEVKGDER